MDCDSTIMLVVLFSKRFFTTLHLSPVYPDVRMYILRAAIITNPDTGHAAQEPHEHSAFGL